MSARDELAEGIRRIKDAERGRGGGGDFLDNRERAVRPDGAVDALELDSFRTGRVNGGVACDVTRGPCRCGAWH